MAASTIFRQVWSLWLTLLTTIAVFTITIIFAAVPATFSNVAHTSESFGRPILVLRVLSGITSILLFATCSAILERAQWLLATRKATMSFPRLLALHSSTGYLGLLLLAFGKCNSEMSTRLIAITRLFVAGLCAILGIVIMSDVQSVLSYQHIHKYTTPAGNGVSTFNGSLAVLPAINVDGYLGAPPVYKFLDAPSEVVIDITPDHLRNRSCSQLNFSGPKSTCERTMFMVGIPPKEVWMEDMLPDADVMTTFDTQGYVLNFGQGDVDTNNPWQFDDETECRYYGPAQAMVQFCIHNERSNKILVRMIPCPFDVATAGKCLTDKSWQSNTTRAASSSLTTTFRWADVAYHRANGTILSHSFTDRPETDAPVASADLFNAYDTFANGTAALLQIAKGFPNSVLSIRQDAVSDFLKIVEPILDGLGDLDGSGGVGTEDTAGGIGDFSKLPGSNPAFPLAMWSTLTSCGALEPKNSRFPPFCNNYLQNFLAIPLHLCQPLRIAQIMGEGPMSLMGLSTDVELEGLLSRLGLDEASIERLKAETPDGVVALSKLRYRIQVGIESLITYAAISGCVLLLCFILMLMTSFEDLEYSSFPLWDFLKRLNVVRIKQHAREEDEDLMPYPNERLEPSTLAIARYAVEVCR